MNWQIFWDQVFYPLRYIGELFFAIFFALLVARISKELEKANIIEKRKKDNFLNHLGKWIIRFVIAFFISVVVIFLIILIIVVIMAIIGATSHFI